MGLNWQKAKRRDSAQAASIVPGVEPERRVFVPRTKKVGNLPPSNPSLLSDLEVALRRRERKVLNQ